MTPSLCCVADGVAHAKPKKPKAMKSTVLPPSAILERDETERLAARDKRMSDLLDKQLATAEAERKAAGTAAAAAAAPFMVSSGAAKPPAPA